MNFSFRFFIVFFFLLLLIPACKVEDVPADMAWDALIAPYHRTMAMNGYTMHYLDIGEGEPLVMVHGFADSTYCWNKNVPALLNKGLRLIVVDMPGLGRSTMPPGDFTPSVENLGEQILLLADKLGLEKFGYVGSSMGGGIGLYLSMYRPERVARMALFDPACYMQKHEGILSLMDVVGNSGMEAMGEWAIRLALRQVYYDNDKVDDVLVHEYARPMAKPGYKQYLRKLLNDYASPLGIAMSNDFHKIRTPTLLIWGAEDRWVPPEFGPRLQAAIPGSQLVMIAKAGHLPHQEKPEEVNPLLIKFFTE